MSDRFHTASRRVFQLAMIVGLMTGSVALAKDNQTIGTLVKLHLPVMMLDIDKGKSHQRQEMLTDTKTVVTLDGKPATLADLVQGMLVRVTYAGRNSMASKIEAITPSTKGS